MKSDIKEKIIKEIPALPETILLEINTIIESFKHGAAPGNHKGRFDDVFGVITEDDARDMLDAIADCERVDADAW